MNHGIHVSRAEDRVCRPGGEVVAARVPLRSGEIRGGRQDRRQAELALSLGAPAAERDGVRALLGADGVPAAALRAPPLARAGGCVSQDDLLVHVQEGGVPRGGQGGALRRLQESVGQVGSQENKFYISEVKINLTLSLEGG